MSVAAVLRTCDYDPTRDKSYQQTRLGRSVADFLAWKRLEGLAERTLDQYERDLARGALMFPSKGLEEFGDSEMTHVANSFSPRQRRSRVEAYRSFFNWAFKTRKLSGFNPIDAIPKIKTPPQRVIDVFTDPEIRRLTDLPVRDGALMRILFDAGLRKAEARHLRLVDLRGNELVVTGKGDKERIVPATVGLLQQLDELRILDGVNPKDFLWYTKPGGHEKVARIFPVGNNSFQTWWIRCLDDAGVRYRNPHTTRHTFATRFLRRGGRIEMLSMAMGHASIKTTVDQYSHLDTRDLAAEFASLFGPDDLLEQQIGV